MDWYGHFDFRHLSRQGTILARLLARSPVRRLFGEYHDILLAPHVLYRESAKNTLADEGQELCLQAFLQGAALTSFYLALVNDTLVETDTLATMLAEPSTNGYARQQITRDNLGWPTLARNIAANETGTAQAGGNTSITLAAAASASDDAYNGVAIETTGGTGPRQWNFIPDYAGATKIATVSRQWTVNPDVTTTYTLHSDFMATSKTLTFSASGGSWGPVNTMVLTNVASGTAGKLISFASLSAAQTPGGGESFTVAYKVTLRAGM